MRGRTTTHARQDKVVATNTSNLAVMKEMNEPRGSSTSGAKALKTVGPASTSARLARLTPISPSLPRRTLGTLRGAARRRRPVRVSGGSTQLGRRFAASCSAHASRRLATGALRVHQKCPGSEDTRCPVQVLGPETHRADWTIAVFNVWNRFAGAPGAGRHRRLDDTRWPSEVGGLTRVQLGGRVGAGRSCGFIRASDGFAHRLVSRCL
jgi:hypothetical protein